MGALGNANLMSKESWTLPKQSVQYRARGLPSTQVAALFSGQGSQYTYMFDDMAMNW